MFRSIGAVIQGLLLVIGLVFVGTFVFVLSGAALGTHPTQMGQLMSDPKALGPIYAFGLATEVLGGWRAGFLAGRREVAHGAAVGAMMGLIQVAAVAFGSAPPSPLTDVLVPAAAAMVGGFIAQVRRTPEAAAPNAAD